MISSKAIYLIQTFSSDEFRKFGLFVSSPYFNKDSILIRFYGILKKYFPKFENRNFEKEKVFALLYPGKKYNDGVMRNILSGTLDLAENFITIQHLQNKEFNFTIAKMKELSDRKMEKLYEKAETEAENILKSSPYKNEEYYHNNFQLINEKRDFSRKQKSSLYVSDDLLSSAAENLTVSFIISMLRSQTYIANTNLRMFNFEADTSQSALETYIDNETAKFQDIAFIQYLNNAFKLARTLEEKYFYRLKDIVANINNEFSDNDMRDMFTMLTNYCYFKINKGDMRFRKEHFLLHKENILRGSYKGERKFLDHIKYLSVVVTGIDAYETEWVEDFIENYRSELDESNMENSYNFCKALVFYHKKEYGKALDWAAKVKTDDLSYKHQLKSLYLKIYFDMNDTEPFYSHIDSYRHFLLNEKHIPEVTRHVIGSYVSSAKKLFDIKNHTAERDFDLFKLKGEIAESRSMINKLWLLEKAAEIEKSRR